MMALSGSDTRPDVAKAPPNVEDIEFPPAARTQAGSVSEAAWKREKEKNALARKDAITRVAIWLLKFCVVSVAIAYGLEILSSFFPIIRHESSAKEVLNIIQYVIAGLIGYLFGQSSTAEK